jgi:hypothetical protein
MSGIRGSRRLHCAEAQCGKVRLKTNEDEVCRSHTSRNLSLSPPPAASTIARLDRDATAQTGADIICGLASGKRAKKGQVG